VSRPRPKLVEWRSAALEEDSGLSWAAKLAAAVYAEHANTDTCVLDPAPSAPKLGREMGASERVARMARAELEAAGWIKVTRRAGAASRIELVAADPSPRHDVPGSDGVTPARTPARTPAPGADELENEKTSPPPFLPSVASYAGANGAEKELPNVQEPSVSQSAARPAAADGRKEGHHLNDETVGGDVAAELERLTRAQRGEP
jgi:hypothetical protein